MEAALLQADRLRERLVRGFAASARAVPGRRFRLSGGVIEADAELSGGGDVIAVPSEQVLLLAVELPLASARERLAALPFAIEGRIADPLEAVHVALGAEIGPRTYLAAIVRHATMRGWIATAATPDAAAALVPDALLLPTPAPGQWAVAVADARALVHVGDGTGFAVPAEQLPIIWASAGRPAVIAWSAGVPAMLEAVPGEAAAAAPLPIDLRQGPYAYRRPVMSALRRRVLAVAAAGIVAHGAIAAADTLVLRHQARARETQTRAMIAAALPALAGADDPVMAAAASLPAPMRGGADPLLPLLARVAAAAGPGALEGLDYDRRGGRLVLAVAAGTEARLAATLAGAGLRATPARGGVVVRDAGS